MRLATEKKIKTTLQHILPKYALEKKALKINFKELGKKSIKNYFKDFIYCSSFSSSYDICAL